MVIDEKDLKYKPFTDNQLTLLRRFHEKMGEVYKSRIIKNEALKGSVHVHINFNGEGSTAEADLPDKDDTNSLLLILSPIVRVNDDSDSIHFEKILSILKRGSANPETMSYFKLLSEQYHRMLKNSGLNYGVNGEKYSDYEVFMLKMNGDLFHNDDKKRKILEDLKSLPYAEEAAVSKTLAVHNTWLRFIDEAIVNNILLTYEQSDSVVKSRKESPSTPNKPRMMPED